MMTGRTSSLISETPGSLPASASRFQAASRTLARSKDGSGASGRFVSVPDVMTVYAEEETRQAISSISHQQVSLEDLITQRRREDPGGYEAALDRIAGESGARARGRLRFSSVPLSDLESEYKTNRLTGLTDSQAALNQIQYGNNAVQHIRQKSTLRIFFGDLKTPLVAFLILGFVVSLVFREWTEGIVIAALILLNAISSTFMQRKANRALEALASLASPDAEIVREGTKRRVPANDVAVGDLVVLTSGGSVPADIRLVEAFDLSVNESLLTGESLDVFKSTIPLTHHNWAFPNTVCFHSTVVTSGSGRGLVVAVGMNTQMGIIAETLAEDARSGSKRTPLEVALARLGGVIGIIVVIILGIIMLIAWLTGYTDPANPDRSTFVNIVILAVGFAVSAMPESLPTVVTTCFAMGCSTLNNINAKVRRLPTVETLGCTSIVFTDKTGTLTSGNVIATDICVAFRRDTSGAEFINAKLYPLHNYSAPELTSIYIGDTPPSVNEVVNLVHLYQQRALQPRLNLAHEANDTVEAAAVRTLLLIARLSAPRCEASFEKGRWVLRGNQTDAAKGRWSEMEGHSDPHKVYPLDDSASIPFNSTRKVEISVYPLFDRGRVFHLNIKTRTEAVAFAAIKGAPEVIASSVRSCLCVESGSIYMDSAQELKESDLESIDQTNQILASKGLRVLGVAFLLLDKENIRELRACDSSNAKFGVISRLPAVWVGLIGCQDPPRPEVIAAVRSCMDANVKVAIITGDQVGNTFALAKLLGVCSNIDEASTCSPLNTMRGDRDEWYCDVDEFTSRTTVFCRARPEDKQIIVQSLQRQGHVVAMTGDGVNDAPALQTADIGIAMGKDGTEVAKAVADLILLTDDFSSIVLAIKEGRRIFANVRKFVIYLMGSDFGEVLYLTIAIIAGVRLPVDALQILFVNLICDSPPAVALAREPAEDNVMQKNPRKRMEPIVGRRHWLFIVAPHVAFTTTIVLLGTMLSTWTTTGVLTNASIANQCILAHDDHQYYCQTSELLWSAGGWVTHVDFIHAGDYLSYYGLSREVNTHIQFFEMYLEQSLDCGPNDLRDSNGWCLPENGLPNSEKHLFVTVRASRQASTQSFVLAAFAEILWPFALRSDQPFYRVFNRSGWLFIGAAFPACLTILITIIPTIRSSMGLVPVSLVRLCLPILAACLVILLDEIAAKPIVRRKYGY